MLLLTWFLLLLLLPLLLLFLGGVVVWLFVVDCLFSCLLFCLLACLLVVVIVCCWRCVFFFEMLSLLMYFMIDLFLRGEKLTSTIRQLESQKLRKTARYCNFWLIQRFPKKKATRKKLSGAVIGERYTCGDSNLPKKKVLVYIQFPEIPVIHDTAPCICIHQ